MIRCAGSIHQARDGKQAFAWGAAHGRLGAGGADAIKEDGGGFVVGVLGDELAFEGFMEDGLAEARGHID